MTLNPKISTKKLLLITGMPGAGKSTIAEGTRDLGFDVINMGDRIREETESRGLAISDMNCGRVMEEIREELGSSVIAKLSIPKILASEKTLIAVDGVRSIAEFEEFERSFPTTRLLAVLASPKRRYELIRSRSRKDKPSDEAAFKSRDERELRVGVGEVISNAGEVLLNEVITLEELKAEVVAITQRVFQQ
jgi:dephospho-CoA kinase